MAPARGIAATGKDRSVTDGVDLTAGSFDLGGYTTADKVAFLRSPGSYPDAPPDVEVVETHMSWVFLSELFAHKLKKPVQNEFLDYRTLEARRRYCEEEIRLNRQLAPNVYIAAVPLVADAGGNLHLDGDGEAVDWLVRMRRLPSGRMLDKAIAGETAGAEEQQAIAALLADFFAGAIKVAIPPVAFHRRLADAIAANRRALEAPEFGMPTAVLGRVAGALTGLLADDPKLFEARVRRGRVIEGHGDLRPEHILSELSPVVIDRVEFNREFRLLDWVEELSFLALECERLGSPGAGKMILESVCNALGDRPPEALISFYKAHRALLRAKLSILHLRDQTISDRENWRSLARSYLELAQTYAGRIL